MKKIIVSILLLSMLTTTANAARWGTPEENGWASKRATTDFVVDEDEFLQEVGVLALDKNAMLVNGAIRYINDDDLQVTPRLIEARTYLPLSAAEVLLKLYTEKSENEAYVDIRYNDIEISDGTNVHYLWTVTNERNEIVLDGKNADFNGVSSQNEYLIYIDGEPYIALRKLSEKIGKKVYYDDGYILIGDTDKVDYVIENTAVFERAKELLADYTPQSQGRTLYVSATAGSNGTGTINNPYSLSKASSVAVAGDTVILRGGTYREMLAPVNDGTASKPVIYKAYEGEKVIISALEEVKGFSTDLEDSTLVSANAITPSNVFDNSRPTEGRYQVFYNGENIPEARYPNINAAEYEIDDISPLFPTKGDIKIVESVRIEGEKLTPTYKAESSTLLQDDEENKWVGATLVTLHGNAWSTSTAKVKASGKGYLELDADTATKRWWFSQAPSSEKNENEAYWPAQWGYLTGHRAAIDLAGEWVVENDKIVMKLPQGATAQNLKIEMKARQLCINLKDKKFIHIDGIETIGGGVTMNNTEMCVVKNCNFRYISHYTQSVDQREAYIDTVYADGQQPCEDNGAPQRGEVGIYLGGKNDVLRDCTIDTSAGAAVYMTGSYTYVHNNNMINCGYQGSYVGGIYISAVGHTPYNVSAYGEKGYRNERGGYVITNNTVRNVARSALAVQPPEYGWKTCQQFAVYMPCEIAYNEFSNGGIASCDTGVVYLTGATMGTKDNQSTFHHNIVYVDAPVAGNFVGMIYYDAQVYEMSNYDNLCFKTREDIKSIFDGTNSWPDSIFVCATEGVYTYSVIGKKDNKYLGYFPEGKDGLKASDYPGGKSFITGVR